MKVDAVIMAKSTMWGAFCVAGIDIHNGEWYRFVSYGDGEPLDDSLMMFLNSGGSCEVLDVAGIRVAEEIPRHNHVEDCMIERDGWLKLGHMSMNEVLEIHPAEEYRYIYGNDREYITDWEIDELDLWYSLILIKVEELRLRVIRNLEGKLKIRAEFVHCGRRYRDIRVTDPDYSAEGLGRGVKVGDAYLVMSVPVKPFQGKYYKLIAKIFQAD